MQTTLVVVLFLGSLSALLINTFSTLLLPQRELEARSQVREASRRMAEFAAPVLESLPERTSDQLEHVHQALREITDRVLADFQGVEGGFYLADGIDRFSGYAFPTHQQGQLLPSPRNDPPPLEAPYIRLQAQQSLSEEPGQPLFIVRDVGPSRVLVMTEPIGLTRPARATTWTMFRLTGPEQLQGQVQRYQVSVGLAVVGMALSLVLMVTLTRSLRRQRRDQEHLRNELRRSEQLAALGKLLAGVAHEIRNPLAGLRSTIQLWERLPEKVPATSSLEAVIQATDRLNDILTRLLHFARTEHAERRQTRVNELVSETFKLLEAQAAAQSVTLDLDLEPGLPLVPGSPTALRQVLLNLATNALQAMPNGGRLRCSTRYQKSQHMVEVLVTDTGHGISPEDQKHLFEPFFTTRPDGTGLGLALCYEIVQQHDGLIELMPRAEPGTTFRVLLPTIT